jgi:hypothetical protein
MRLEERLNGARAQRASVHSLCGARISAAGRAQLKSRIHRSETAGHATEMRRGWASSRRVVGVHDAKRPAADREPRDAEWGPGAAGLLSSAVKEAERSGRALTRWSRLARRLRGGQGRHTLPGA